MFLSSVVIFLLLLQVFYRGTSGIEWRSRSYVGIPIGENAVGATIFDPGIGTNYSECTGTTGAVSVTLISCPLATTTYFSISDNKVVLAISYPLTKLGYSAALPDCIISCTDSTNKPVSTALTILIYNAANQAPVWSREFPNNVTIDSLQPPQLLLITPASDLDTDKITNGRLTYNVDSIDGATVVTGVNDFLQYKNNGTSPDLLVVYTLPWDGGSQHMIVVSARDNPINKTMTNVITRSITITVLSGVTIGSKVIFPTTSSTAVYNVSAQAVIGYTSTVSPCDQWGTSLDSVVCGNNWIWLAVGGAGLVSIIIVIIVAAICFRRYGKNNAVNYQDASKPKQHHQHRQAVHPSDNANNTTNNSSTVNNTPAPPVSTRTLHSNRPEDPGHVSTRR